MIGQHSTYLEVGRCCSAETRQPDSPRPSTSASSCNRFDFARPLVSTDVYAVPLNRTGAPTRRVPLVGTSGMKILERNRTNEKKVEFADVGSWLGDRPLWMKLRRFFFFFAGSAATTISTRVCNRHKAENFAASSSRGKLRGWKKGRVSRFRSYDYPAGIPRHFSSFLSPFLPHRVPSFFRRRKSVHPFLLAAAPLKEIKFTSVGEVTRTFSLSLGSPRSLRGKRFR